MLVPLLALSWARGLDSEMGRPAAFGLKISDSPHRETGQGPCRNTGKSAFPALCQQDVFFPPSTSANEPGGHTAAGLCSWERGRELTAVLSPC